jgi:hypothetical protein
MNGFPENLEAMEPTATQVGSRRKALTRSVRWHLALWHLRCALDHLRAILRGRR